MTHNLFNTLQEFTTGSGKKAKYYSLPELEKAGVGKISRVPVSIRIVLESVLRNCDGARVEGRECLLRVAMEPARGAYEAARAHPLGHAGSGVQA